MWRCLGRAQRLAVLLLLAGCTGAPLVGLEISDYRTTFNTTGDEQLLVNILRAKDGAPLHFAELSTIGASNQLTASLQATDPIGERNGSSTRAGLQGTASAQASPVFSLGTLDTQLFTQGLINPIGPDIIQQFLEEGIDQRLILILFFSGYTEHGITHYNNIKCDFATPRCHDNFFLYLSNIDSIAGKHRQIIAHKYVELTPMGAPLPWASTGVKDIAGIDPTKYRVEPYFRDQNKGLVYSISPDAKLALCYARTHGNPVPIVEVPNPGICWQDRVYVSPYRNNSQSTNGLIVRSTYEVIEFLGQVLNYQETLRKQGQDRCITVSGTKPYTCEQDVIFQVNSGKGTPLVRTDYEGFSYTVSSDTCNDLATCDHSGEVLKMVNLLINYNKSAATIPQVPLVRTIQ
jgi:hypothetical protein